MKKYIAIILLLLMFSLSACCKPIIKTEYIKITIPELPSEPTYFRVVWSLWYYKYADDAKTIIVSTEGKEGYTPAYVFTGGEAKSLLKNITIEKSYSNDLKMILDGLK